MFTENGYQQNTNIPNDFIVYDAKPAKKRNKSTHKKTIGEKLDLFILPLVGACALSLAYLILQTARNANIVAAIASLL